MQRILKTGLAAAVILLIGAGCAPQASVSTDVQVQTPPSEPSVQAQTFVAQGLSFTLPNPDWKVESNDGGRIAILTASSPYAVKLSLAISKGSKADWDDPKELFSSGDLRLNSVFCGGSNGGCYGLETASGAYAVNWYVDSDQPEPPGTEGAGSWSPDKNFTEADIEAMLKTAVEVK